MCAEKAGQPRNAPRIEDDQVDPPQVAFFVFDSSLIIFVLQTPQEYSDHTGYIPPCPRFSLPTLIFHKHERQDNVVQHTHSRRVDFESRLLFLPEVMRAVELSNHCLLLIGGDQLHTAVQHRGYRQGGEYTYLGMVCPRCSQRPSVLYAVWSSKRVAPIV